MGVILTTRVGMNLDIEQIMWGKNNQNFSCSYQKRQKYRLKSNK
ncbi:hypothetical protein DDI_4287 [Dickeya dianthicola RNS04.9]|nr:hypothetical protein DDI_4287 [Dickeya dianthicola RNS04.9]